MSGEPAKRLSGSKEDDKITCKVCGGTFIRKECKEHKYTPKHIEAQKKQENGIITCKDCGNQYVRGCWEEHEKDEEHQKAVVQKEQLKKKHEDDVVVCKFCNEEYIRKDLEEHKKTEKHREAQKQSYGDCDVCKERYVKKYWKEHTKSEKHTLFERKRQNKKVENLPEERREKEKYKIRQGSEENRDYINALTAFFLLRYAFKDKDFKLSVNNEEWAQFGDIVIEDDLKIEAICCKKIQSKNNFPLLVLTAESGKLSVKEQYEILESLKGNKRDFSKVSFNLHTISGLLIEGSCQFVYDDAVVEKWQEKGKAASWKDRQVEIMQKKGYKKRDLLNTTDDSEDIFVVKVVPTTEFQMYINQKQETELKSAIHSMLENKFGTTKNISDLVIKFVREFFTDRVTKKEHNFKMTREDVLLKIAELLLVPYLVLPDGIIEEKEIALWTKTLANFDFVVMKNDCDVIKNIYSSINHILKTETKYTLNHKVLIDKKNVKNETLKSAIFNSFAFDGSLRSMYLTLWKTGLTPLVLEAEDGDQLSLILKVISFLKSELSTCFKFIIVTDMEMDHSLFSDELNAFVNGEDLRLLEYNNFQEILTETKINFLNLNDILLKEIVSCNADFLEKLTPDTLLNMFMGEFSFKDVQIPITEETTEFTLVLEKETMKASEKYFRERDYEVVEELDNLSYFISLEGKPCLVKVPPEI